jgi:hypothetical protein
MGRRAMPPGSCRCTCFSQETNTVIQIDLDYSICTCRNRRASGSRQLHQWDRMWTYSKLKIKKKEGCRHNHPRSFFVYLQTEPAGYGFSLSGADPFPLPLQSPLPETPTSSDVRKQSSFAIHH